MLRHYTWVRARFVSVPGAWRSCPGHYAFTTFSYYILLNFYRAFHNQVTPNMARFLRAPELAAASATAAVLLLAAEPLTVVDTLVEALVLALEEMSRFAVGVVVVVVIAATLSDELATITPPLLVTGILHPSASVVIIATVNPFSSVVCTLVSSRSRVTMQ